MSVELKWVPTWEASDHRAKGWSEVLLHDGGCEEGHFLMASPVEEEPAKVECNPHEHTWHRGECTTCQPAQPEPAAPVGNEDCQKAKAEGPWLAEVLKPAAPVEMPEVVADALIALRSGAFPNLANDLESFWRSQPVAVGISEELESVLRSAKEYEMAVRTGTSVEWHAYDADRIGAAIAAVREQYGRKG